MKHYEVTVMRKMLYRVEIEADSKTEAENEVIEMVEDGHIRPLNLEVEAELVKIEEMK